MVLHGKVCFHLFASNEVNLTHFLTSVVLVATIVPKFDQRFVVLFRRLVPQNQKLSCKETEEDEAQKLFPGPNAAKLILLLLAVP